MLDITKLLEPISDETPCGEDLEYDPKFMELFQIAEEKNEQQFGDTIIEAEEVDWKSIKKIATDLTKKTKDLRVLILLAKSSLKQDGFGSFSEALSLIAQLIENSWDGIHPELDPDDDNDPTMRINILTELVSPKNFLKEIRFAPMVSSKALGRFCYEQIAVSSGIIEGDDKYNVDGKTLDAAFQDSDPETIKKDADAVSFGIEALKKLENTVSEKVGVVNGVNLDPLCKLMEKVHAEFIKKLEFLGVFNDDAASEGDVEVASGAVSSPGAQANGSSFTGDITSREDVVRAIDSICLYYQKFEPSSPIPILIRRCRNLVSKSFLQILEDLVPDGIRAVGVIAGTTDEVPQITPSSTSRPAAATNTAPIEKSAYNEMVEVVDD
ncbi:type VI secretion system protein TssA [Pelagibaculum spongiae]|uniref:type VI secretion system protein TssA n=1 Tax=Pelagibaculum spongiae TaxID=2080658 RepID=UPI00131438A1|nr:type VI secretion system protein TssA [Pelagibaculum spongiae]